MEIIDTTICPHCHKYVEYTIKTELNNAFIKCSEITFKKKVAYCTECGNPVWVAWLDDYNANKPYIKYALINNDIELYDRISNKYSDEKWWDTLLKDIEEE